jgi:hypothetical protein
MIRYEIDAHIQYRHTPEETAALSAAIIPMAEYIRKTAGPPFHGRIKHILAGEYFRWREAVSMKDALLRAVKQARKSLGDYFPNMRQQILVNAQALEDATYAYWTMVQAAREETFVRP